MRAPLLRQSLNDEVPAAASAEPFVIIKDTSSDLPRHRETIASIDMRELVVQIALAQETLQYLAKKTLERSFSYFYELHAPVRTAADDDAQSVRPESVRASTQ